MQHQARRCGVTGWVRNAPDGAVEFLIQGEGSRVGTLLDWARRGPTGARVDALDVHDVESHNDLRDFQVRF